MCLLYSLARGVHRLVYGRHRRRRALHTKPVAPVFACRFNYLDVSGCCSLRRDVEMRFVAPRQYPRYMPCCCAPFAVAAQQAASLVYVRYATPQVIRLILPYKYEWTTAGALVGTTPPCQAKRSRERRAHHNQQISTPQVFKFWWTNYCYAYLVVGLGVGPFWRLSKRQYAISLTRDRAAVVLDTVVSTCIMNAPGSVYFAGATTLCD